MQLMHHYGRERRVLVGAITLRKLPPKVSAAIRKRAEQGKTSLNKAVIGMLEESTAVGPARPVSDDLDALCGLWAPAEGRAFERALSEQRALDPEVWK